MESDHLTIETVGMDEECKAKEQVGKYLEKISSNDGGKEGLESHQVTLEDLGRDKEDKAK